MPSRPHNSVPGGYDVPGTLPHQIDPNRPMDADVRHTLMTIESPISEVSPTRPMSGLRWSRLAERQTGFGPVTDRPCELYPSAPCVLSTNHRQIRRWRLPVRASTKTLRCRDRVVATGSNLQVPPQHRLPRILLLFPCPESPEVPAGLMSGVVADAPHRPQPGGDAPTAILRRIAT